MRFNPNDAREIIMSNYKKAKEHKNVFHFVSETCSDDIFLYAKFENDVLVDYDYTAKGCSVFLSATEIFLNLVKNKTRSQIKELYALFDQFINQENLTEEQVTSLGDLWVFFNVKTHLNRVACALLTPKNLEKL
ncbi:iron-sulfur cluster assembly scaffold protein [Mycoplasmopsis gallinacea]|uniref:Aminotransferase protein U-like protein n=1 Tax=Mycoplasmopsis gallinacea TaxID=29556 RepID=A0A449A434_9BACT|nr:iron-sulfur cluster assembly scaffold protein [Mycoplasmopsis gallinacea]VEU59009.1 aminotransferase protein U-like protein [Mycoplasmopsis gallinacea]